MSRAGGDRAGVRLTLLTHAPTAATAGVAFPAGEGLDDRGRAWAAAARGWVPRTDRVVHAPDAPARETCALLQLSGRDDDGLRGWDLGEWTGRTLDELAAERPDDVAAWLADPSVTPHGGEPLTELIARVRGRLGGVDPGHTLAVCGAAVVRAAVVAVLDAPPAAFWRVDAAPLTLTDLRGGPDRWTLRATGASLTPRRPGGTG